MRLTPRLIALLVLLATAAGVSVYAWSAGLVVDPPDPRQLAEERRQEDERAQAKWRETLDWTQWVSQGGLRLRAGFPAKIEIGVMFVVALEVESLPAEAAPERRWFFGGWPPNVHLRFLDEQGAEYAQIKEWTIYDGPGHPPLPDMRAGFDLTQPNRAFLQRQIIVPASKDAVKPGDTRVSIRLWRDQSTSYRDPDHLWRGHVDTPAHPIEVLPTSMETKTFLLPTRLRVVESTFEDVDRKGVRKRTRMARVTYSKSDAEKVTLTYPKGAMIQGTFSCNEVPGMMGAMGGVGAVFTPNDVNGIDQWFNPKGLIEKTYNLAVTYTLPAPVSEGGYPTPTVLWKRTVSVKYDAGQAK